MSISGLWAAAVPNTILQFNNNPAVHVAEMSSVSFQVCPNIIFSCFNAGVDNAIEPYYSSSNATYTFYHEGYTASSAGGKAWPGGHVYAAIDYTASFVPSKDTLICTNTTGLGLISQTYTTSTCTLDLFFATTTTVNIQTVLRSLTLNIIGAKDSATRNVRIWVCPLGFAYASNPYPRGGRLYAIVDTLYGTNTSGTFTYNNVSSNFTTNPCTRYGLKGYFASQMTASEHAALLTLSGYDSAAAWIGGHTVGFVAAASGVNWIWVDGPDAGTTFWTGLAAGSAQNGAFTSWNTGEPNGGGNSGYVYAWGTSNTTGTWNDDTNVSLNAYYLEFGTGAITDGNVIQIQVQPKNALMMGNPF